MKPDAIIEVRFKTTAEGGRQGAIVIREIPFGCPLMVGRDAFDCRVLISNQILELGKTYELPIKFLHPQFALSRLSEGTSVKLWEGKDIAIGTVVKLCQEDPNKD